MLYNFLSAKSTISFLCSQARLHLSMARNSRDICASRSLANIRRSRANASAFVFGNGPSLRLISPEKVDKLLLSERFDLYVVNNFILSSFFRSLSIGGRIYLLLSDPEAFSESSEPFLQVVSENISSGKIYGLCLPSWIKLDFRWTNAMIRDFLSRWEKAIDIFYFNDSQGSVVFSRNIDPTKPRSYVSMSVYKSLAIAGWTGYKNIYLGGVDNTYAGFLANDNENRVFRTDAHFDATAYSTDSVKDYFWSNQGVDMAGALMESALLFADLKYKFATLPVRNLDRSSLVDAFPKHHALDVYV